ncbi:MAG: hypothetical protein ABMA00_14895 [Gemmatimonas sp.]
MDEAPKSKPTLRARADKIKDFRCKNLIAVIEHPDDIRNIGTIIRNVSALGVDKAYVVTGEALLPDEWADIRTKRALNAISASALAIALGVFTPALVTAQRLHTVAVDATVGSATGRGGDFKDPWMVGARLAASVRFGRGTHLRYFAELATDGLALAKADLPYCSLSSRGGCQRTYPEFTGTTAVVGLVNTRTDDVELRAGLGAGTYRASGTRVGAVLAQLDVTGFFTSHVGVVVGARQVVVPRYRRDKLTIRPWMLGVRVR